MMARLHLLRPGFGPAPFERMAGPAPEIEGGIAVGFAFGDGDGGGEEAVGEEVGGYFRS